MRPINLMNQGMVEFMVKHVGINMFRVEPLIKSGPAILYVVLLKSVPYKNVLCVCPLFSSVFQEALHKPLRRECLVDLFQNLLNVPHMRVAHLRHLFS